jgi:hypothetical protein
MQNIFTLEIHCQLMLDFYYGVVRLHHVGRGCRELKSWLSPNIIIAHFSQADQVHVNTAQVVGLVLESQRDSV